MGRWCYQCQKEKGSCEVFDIRFLNGTIHWCFECASKQVYPDITDWRFFEVHNKGDQRTTKNLPKSNELVDNKEVV